MKKFSIGKLIGAALAAGMIPYRVKTDEETGSFEMGALLWTLKKTPGEEKDNYTIELLPFMGKDEEFPEDVQDVEV